MHNTKALLPNVLILVVNALTLSLPPRQTADFSKSANKDTACVQYTIWKPLISLFKDVRAQKFPRTDFFKTFTAGRKW